MNRLRLLASLWGLLILAACGASGQATRQPTLAPTPPEPAPTAAPALPAPTAAPASTAAPPEAAPSAPGAAIPSGKTAEGYNYLGSPDAPLQITMYSDFL